MCGIAGFLDPNVQGVELQARLSVMLDRIAHRGPDDHGSWFCDVVSMGHRRLAIVDLSPAGHQPMASAKGRTTIVFNGEIYNHVELRAELEADGHVFRGHSDTEVLLELIEKLGLDAALQRCVGMFALAVWDGVRRCLHLARDRFGEKPLYLASTGDAWLFASELKALMAYPTMVRRLDARAVHAVLSHGYVGPEDSIFAGVRQVPPGGIVEIAMRDGRWDASTRRYWSVEQAAERALKDPFMGGFEEAVEAVTAQMTDAVELQMQADVSLGSFLSGGIDSSLVTALMQSRARQPVRTYSIGFHHDSLDEAAHAKAVAQHLGTVHTEWYVDSSEVLSLVPDLPEHFDEPLADASQLPTMILSRLTRQDVTVALSGDGADEIFGGYPKYALGERLLARPGRRVVGLFARMVSRGVTRPLGRMAPTRWTRHVPLHRVDAVADVYGSPDAAALASRLGALNREPARYMEEALRRELCTEAIAMTPLQTGAWDYVRQAMFYDLTHYLPGDILVKVDRATMAASLESRAPFLDHRVFELALRLPTSHLFVGGRGKRVLRAALEQLVPAELIDRPKAGFIPPLGNWLRGPLRSWAEDLLSSEAARSVLDVQACRHLLRLHCESRFDLSARLWPMLTLAAWSARWLGDRR